MNVFRPVNDSEILPERIYRGKSWKNISFGKNASVKDYQDRGLYLEVGIKPASDPLCDTVLMQEVIDHTNKEIRLIWSLHKKTGEALLSAVKSEAKKVMDALLDKGYSYKDVIYQCQDKDIASFNLGLTLIALTGMTTVNCRAMDNSMHVLTITEYNELTAGLAIHYSTAKQVYWNTVADGGI